MRRIVALSTLTTLLALALGISPRADGKRFWSHIEALANDGMAGRLTGSPEHKRAAEYVAKHFENAGLEPAGVGGYIQPVKLKTRRIVTQFQRPSVKEHTESHAGALLGTRFRKNELPPAPSGNRCISTGRPPMIRRSGSPTAR